MSSTNTSGLSALVSTIEPIDGGVPTMTRWICELLEELGITPILAWYAPWRNHPKLSIPLYSLPSGAKPRMISDYAFGRYESYGLGCWLPEFEFTHYFATKMWKELISRCHFHLAVSGNALCALPYLQSKVHFLAWIATPWEADRKNRIRQLIVPRRILDSVVNTPILRKLEKRILNCKQGKILSLSNYTSNELRSLSQLEHKEVMYMPVDTNLFQPDYSKTSQWRIGFSGRYCDPRKNIDLLLGAMRILLNQGYRPELILVGERKAEQLRPMIRQYGLEDNVACLMHLSPRDLAGLLQTLDLFAIPSHQEGLCIAALEAMACGVPVVSTRCGGPEDYVQPGVTGELVEEKTVAAFASTVKSVCISRKRRQQLSAGSIDWIEQHATKDVARKEFRKHLTAYAEQKGYQIN
ncbi:MAG: glycosyltransferase family 4 protein [Cyanobacteriota bacterium]|nr:glycosyltransferase family 4 protein [Cyanobacteriota bacterium]